LGFAAFALGFWLNVTAGVSGFNLGFWLKVTIGVTGMSEGLAAKWDTSGIPNAAFTPGCLKTVESTTLTY
jgi:hypothetical protein